MAGRRPTPTPLKELAGNPGKRPLNRAEPKPRRRKPRPPAHLTPEALREWRRLVRILEPAGILTEAEADVLAVYCQTYLRWVEASRKLAEEGMVIVTEKGWPVQSPWLAILNGAIKTMHRCMVELGLTPAARSRIVAVNEQAEDPFDAFINGG